MAKTGKVREGRNGGTLKSGGTRSPGRPPRVMTQMLKQLTSEGYGRVTKSMVIEIYEALLAIPTERLQELAKDKQQPGCIRLCAEALVSKRGFDVLETMLDRAHGKPKQTIAGDADNPLLSGNIKIEFSASGVQPITSEAQIEKMLNMKSDE